MPNNPFYYGNPVSPDQFLDRRRALRRLTGRIVNRGQSAAIVGEPRSGKTSLLDYLAAHETQEILYGDKGRQLLFSYLDAQTLGGEFSQAQFWEYALRPLREQVITPKSGTRLAEPYKLCVDNAFGWFVMERLLTQMCEEGWRLVLLLDEFSDLLHHPILHSAEFFGGLRSLATRSRGALALMIASNRSVEELNQETQGLSRAGSPYFNFLTEIVLGPLPQKDIKALLRHAEIFTIDDRRFVRRITGGHPYLLQVAASALWDAYEDGEEDPDTRRQMAGQTLYDEAASTLRHPWQYWPPARRKALTAVALAHLSTLEQKKFDIKRVIEDLNDLGPEIRSLKKRGYVKEDESIPGGWRIRPQAFLWWLADEIVRTTRRKTPFDDWLRQQELGFLLTRGEKEQLNRATRAIADILKEGAITLIRAAASKAGSALIK